ncbi:hypothetical protein J5I95_13855 [Candidatus Poribacteria bacterium]|nr:hypothetical protein [Candidatus Poribacteria bacterium]
MAANRYGRIYHSDHHYINLRFPSVDARREFAEKFEKYHAGHDHDGEVPRFEDTTSSVIGNPESNTIHDAHSVSIDGYATYEIEDYHNPDRWNTYNRSRYRPPTCCVPPTISVNRTFIDSSALTRHELSAIFMDMPEEDFQNLLKSVETEGFKDPIIRMIDAEVLDGWHRYRAAKELNLLRKLTFQQWKEKDEGNPAAFVMARNIERRHLTPGQRAQIVVSFNERFGHGGDRGKSQNCDLKTQAELAAEAGASQRTISNAVAVEKAGRSEEVIKGEKSATEVITEETIKSLWEQITPAISEWKKEREGVGHASKSMLIKATLRWEGLPSDTETDVKVLKQLLYLLTTTETNILQHLIRKLLDGKDLWDDAEDLAEKRKRALDAEHRMFDALDEVAPDWDTDDFIAAASDKHNWGVTEFPDLDETDMPAVWEARYNLLHTEITQPAAWIQEMLDKMAEPTEKPTQTAEAREANKLLKKKKQLIKSMWDKRSQAAQDWLGTADNDLTTYTELDELEKGFATCEEHAYCRDVFESGMRRIKGQTFNICLEKTLASDVSLETLEAELQAISTYAFDILHWERQEWIQQLIAKNKAKAEEAPAPAPEPEPETTEPDMAALWEAFNKRLPKWKAKYAESGYKENDLIQASTEAELFDALRDYRDSDRTGPVTAEEIGDVTDLMKSQSYPFAHCLRNLLRDKRKSEGGDPNAEAEADTSLDDLNLPALKSFLDSLMYHVGHVENSEKRDDLSVAVWEVFYPDEGDTWEVTVRDVLSILIDCAQTAITEEE